jgi:hypothetical protein
LPFVLDITRVNPPNFDPKFSNENKADRPPEECDLPGAFFGAVKSNVALKLTKYTDLKLQGSFGLFYLGLFDEGEFIAIKLGCQDY